MKLPELTSTSIRHPDCCLSLSEPLLDTLLSLDYSGDAYILSIGSGTGLLEALLIDRTEKASATTTSSSGSVTIRGVEVLDSPNKYLAEDQLYLAAGTWDICPAADEATVWMLVYPRDVDLLAKYIKMHRGQHQKVRKVIWLGPIVDWESYRPLLQSWCGSEVRELKGAKCGIEEYEMMGIAERETQ
ncbi:MAG: hypothetical protein MMC23_001135 [Stictis urceolatum]|nr:hypothetical protein [Stictis urceolata]